MLTNFFIYYCHCFGLKLLYFCKCNDLLGDGVRSLGLKDFYLVFELRPGTSVSVRRSVFSNGS